MHLRWLAAVCALLALLLALPWTQALDRLAGPLVDSGARSWGWVTRLGDTRVLWAVGLSATALFALRRRRLDAFLMGWLTATAWALAWSLKLLIARPRPEGVLEPASPAFPSGHALGAAAVYVGLALLAPTHRRALFAGIALAALVGWSRLALGVHYLSDVVGGWLLGAALVMAALDLQSSIRATPGGATPEVPPPGPAPPAAP